MHIYDITVKNALVQCDSVHPLFSNLPSPTESYRLLSSTEACNTITFARNGRQEDALKSKKSLIHRQWDRWQCIRDRDRIPFGADGCSTHPSAEVMPETKPAGFTHLCCQSCHDHLIALLNIPPTFWPPRKRAACQRP